MRVFPAILLLSLVVNLALGGWWLTRRSSQPGAKAETAASSPMASIREARAQRAASLPAAAIRPTVPSNTEEISWEHIQAQELKLYVANLRAVKCPEVTIQEIILAEVNRRYQSRSRELWPERYAMKPYWEVEKRDPEAMKKNRERYKADREMQKEKSALLVELLGVDPEKLRREEEGYDAYMSYQERQVSFLPEAKRAEALKILESFEEKSQEMYERNRGLWDAESRAEQRQLEADKLKGLAQYLTPQELREYELRQSQTASQLSHDLRFLSINRQEYEAIFDIRKKYADSIYNYGDLDEAGRKQAEETKKKMNSEIAAAIGAQKGIEYERSQDYSYQQLAQLARKYELPADTAGKVYDYKAIAEQSVKRIREDASLTSEQRQTALQEIRKETEKTVTAALGEQNFKRYLRSGGYWLNNLAPTPRPAPPAPR